MDDISNSVVEAKKQYTQQLVDILTPYIYQGLRSILQTCKDEKKVLKTFQEKLCSVPKWNQDIIDKEYERILIDHDKEFIEKLIEAVFISNVKVLSTIRVGKNKPINIKIPESKAFLHKCYIECARHIFQDPYLMDDRESHLSFSEIQRNIKRSQVAISMCIDKTIRDLIPIQKILENYLNDIESDEEKQEGGEADDNTEDVEDDEDDQNEKDEKDELDSIKDNPEIYDNNEDPVFTREPDLNVSEGTSIEHTPQISQGDGEIKNIIISHNESSQGGEKKVIDDDTYGSNIADGDPDEDPFFSDED